MSVAGPSQLLGKQYWKAISSGPSELAPTGGTVPVTVEVDVDPEVNEAEVESVWAHAEAPKRATETRVVNIFLSRGQSRSYLKNVTLNEGQTSRRV